MAAASAKDISSESSSAATAVAMASDVVHRLLKAALAAKALAPEGEGTGMQERAASEALLAGVLQTPPADGALLRVQALLDRTWERLNTGHWSAVPLERRRLFALASLHKVWLLLARGSLDSARSKNEGYVPGDSATCYCAEEDVKTLKTALAAADQGLLLGAPLPLDSTARGEGGADAEKEALTAAASVLTRALRTITETEKGDDGGSGGRCTKTNVSQEECCLTTMSAELPVSSSVPALPVPTLQNPSLEHFCREHFQPQRPALLIGAAEHWPAHRRWSDLAYLRRVAGARTVPVELGAHYADPNWAQRLMTLDEFVSAHVQPPCDELRSPRLGYLAQHPLFEQVPELRADICVPEYCCLSDDPDGSVDPDINAWFGPAGTVSPLHFDPKHNLLSQVVGSKVILLYPPDASSSLYPHEGPLLSNTAQVDPEKPDYDRFPMLKQVQAFKCVLQPGDILYIPPRWWHHVRSLSTSFSVSFWWQ